MSTVLIADPDYDTRYILAEALKNEKISGVEAADPELAYDIAREVAIDVVILDYPLRMNTGVSLTRTLREHPRLGALPILNFTSRAVDTVLADARVDGVTHTICKPAPIHELVETVAALLYAGGATR